MKKIYLYLMLLVPSMAIQAQDYTFEDFIGTWHGYISSEWNGYNDPMTMVIEPDGFYTETSGHLMPTLYPNTQESDFQVETNRYHWRYLETIYVGQYFYADFFYEVVYFQNDTLEMHYNFWDDSEPHPDAGTIFLVRETSVGIDEEPVSIYNPGRKLLKVYDMLGREADPESRDAILIYQYDDGFYEKRYNTGPYRNR